KNKKSHIMKKVNYFIAMSLLGIIIFPSCKKENVTPTSVVSDQKSASNGTRSTDQLFSATKYETLPSMVYRIQSRDVLNCSVIDATYASFFTGTSWSSAATTGTIGTDGTNFFGTNYDGNTYYSSASGGTSYPISTTPLTTGGSIFIADEIEYCTGNVYAINTGGSFYRINNMTTSTPTVTNVGPLFGSAKFDFNRKSLYRNPSTNTLHMVRGDLGSNTIKAYSINTSTGAATLTNSYSGITFNSNSNISSYHNGTDLYVYVQTIATGSGFTSYTLYSINSSGVVTIVITSSHYLSGDFAYIP
ncbi:MAG TPA: hypothetical protein VJI69_01650, partial [Bacteroidia bacterium]|nr:hypothetical protein [Bacteroidia bacterium]